jgi:hypothetical protein
MQAPQGKFAEVNGVGLHYLIAGKGDRHFHFYGKTPLTLLSGREPIYLEHFWNDFAAEPKKSVPEKRSRILRQGLCPARPHGRRDGSFPRLPKRRRGFRRICKNQADDADAGAVRGKSRRSVPDRAGQDGGD